MTKQAPSTISSSSRTAAVSLSKSPSDDDMPKDILHAVPQPHSSSVFQLIVCIGGIYVSFLTWALLQERITTTTYGPDRLIFRSPLVLNTVQSLFASLTGYLYFSYTRRQTPTPGSKPQPRAVFPDRESTLRLLLVAVTQSLASPFGYAALQHIDYITFILAKSCKLLPVMFLHLTVFRRSYPFYKYAVVAAVTAGVAVFTIYHPGTASKAAKAAAKQAGGEGKSTAWGMALLATNLLFDGLTNSMQDHMFATARPGTISGPQMMVALNVLSSALTGGYLLLAPYLSLVAPLPNSAELASASAFIAAHPGVLYDILGFAAAGAFGQVFIFHTLAKFGSLVLVTVTVTRKMVSMMLSVVWFGHRLSGMQWLGVGMVFGGIGAEAEIKRRGEVAKKAAARAREVKKVN